MPYSGPEDDKLPSHIATLPEKQRGIFVSAFNSSYAQCQDEDGDGCEGRAMRIANAAVNREREKQGDKPMSQSDRKTKDENKGAQDGKAVLFEANGEHSGLLVAVWLDEATANALAIADGEAPEDLHVTLCYCGDVSELPDAGLGRAIDNIHAVAEYFAPLSGQIAGLGRFNASDSSDGKDVLYANVDVPGLERLRQMIATYLEEAGCAPLGNHGYTPHITLAYLDEGADFPMQRIDTLPLRINSIWISIGDKRLEIPLSGEMKSYKADARNAAADLKRIQGIHDMAAELGAACGNQGQKADGVLGAVSMLNGLYGDPEHELTKSIHYPIKALGGDRLGGYMMLWGNPDELDLAGEYFTPETEELTAIFKAMGKLPFLYNHALDDTLKTEVVGVIDVLQADDVGLWYEAQLSSANKYKQAIKDLARKRALGTSSGTLPGARKVAGDGRILRWPVVEGSATVQPADPRQMERPIGEVKTHFASIGLEFEPETNGRGGEEPQDSVVKSRLRLLDLLQLESTD